MSVTVKPEGWYSAQIALNQIKTSSGSFGFALLYSPGAGKELLITCFYYRKD